MELPPYASPSTSSCVRVAGATDATRANLSVPTDKNRLMTAPITICPYCGLPFTDDKPATHDHVFVDAVGGFTKVDAHRKCNSSIGDAIEGKLQAPNSLLNLSKVVSGKAKPVSGVIKSTGDAVTYDFRTGEVRHANPVEKIDGPDVTTFKIKGSPGQVEQILRQQGRSSEEIDSLLATAERVSLAADWFEFNVAHPLPLAGRLAAKVALGAGAVMGGDAFTSSSLAGRLRDILWERWEPTAVIAAEFLQVTDAALQQAWVNIGATPPPALVPSESISQVVFASLGQSRESTAVLVHLVGHPIAMSGAVIDAPMPLSSGMPVLIRDRPGNPIVVKIHDELEAAVLALNARSGPHEHHY